MIKDRELYALSVRLGAMLKQDKKFITCAESCTGGWVSKTITDVSGSANWFERGFITYGNQAKTDLLGVQPHTLEQYGAVSNPVVLEMVRGALSAADADYAVAISGVADSNGDTIEKPVGTVWFGFSARDREPFSQLMHFKGDRNSVRRKAVYFSLTTLLTTLL
ncbi:MAG: NMN aminohydrolase [Sodalis sp. Psp]|nr:NMN aminohydrolase [Sodalis sp. Psp]MCR3756776.1 NMN aminohydrolase [Sodalis sp. Ppy]